MIPHLGICLTTGYTNKAKTIHKLSSHSKWAKGKANKIVTSARNRNMVVAVSAAVPWEVTSVAAS